jgi:hypothetical protein
MIKNNLFVEFYENVAELVGSNKDDWPILDELCLYLVQVEKKLNKYLESDNTESNNNDNA